MANSEDRTHEREAIEELLRSEGWAVFERRVRSEWQGDGYFARMGTALNSNDPLAPKVTHRASVEMLRMLQWPKDRLLHLTKGKSE